MRSKLQTSLAVLVLAAPMAAIPAVAVAATGGASAPSPSAPSGTTSSTKAKIRPSGIATWFGPGFYGSKTACGQTLTPSTVGVANRTLPCGTLVKVSYKGHAITVPVLDRGPYSHHADWDLTAGAAQALGITETVRIATAIVGSTPNVPTLGLPPAPPSATVAGGASAG
jgi:rare lipoprotein A